MIVTADNNGGRYNQVHRQTDDGIVISVAMGKNLTPLVFRYKDYLGCFAESLIAGAFYPHKRLMRGDCGWREEDDSVDLLFSWKALEKRTDGFTDAPSGEFSEAWHEEPNCAKDVRICGLAGHRKVFYRKDREYWTPDSLLSAEAPVDPFAFDTNMESNDCCNDLKKEYPITTVRQWNPQTCPPEAPNKCGLVNYYDECDKARKIRPNHCRLKGGEDEFGNPIATNL